MSKPYYSSESQADPLHIELRHRAKERGFPHRISDEWKLSDEQIAALNESLFADGLMERHQTERGVEYSAPTDLWPRPGSTPEEYFAAFERRRALREKRKETE